MGIRDLVKVANRLDNLGLNSEADALDRIIRKIAEEPQGMVAPVGGSEDWKKGMPWPSSYDPSYSPGASNVPPKPAPTYGTYQDPEFAFARWVGSQDTVSKQTDRAAFEREFHRLWRMNKNSKGADAEGKYTPAQWIELGLKFSPEIWESMQDRSVSAPKPAPKPKATMTDEQRWDAYVKRVPNGYIVKNMWINNQAGINLGTGNSFASFSTWLKSYMEKYGIKNIGAIDLVGIMQKETDIKRAKNSDVIAGRQYSRTVNNVETSNSVERAMENAWSTNDKAEIKRLRDRLNVEEGKAS